MCAKAIIDWTIVVCVCVSVRSDSEYIVGIYAAVIPSMSPPPPPPPPPQALYGDLERADGYYGAVRGRRWKVDWNRAPQPVQIRIQTLRGVRDKLPGTVHVYNSTAQRTYNVRVGDPMRSKLHFCRLE